MKLTKQILTYTLPKEDIDNLNQEIGVIVREKHNNGWKWLNTANLEEVNHSYARITIEFERDYEE